jgi:NAD(P)-dependent dehydrogenase (short-subunit alcohol dehydrogenase family)
MDLRGKIALATGASSGIGKAIAIAFAQKRARVLVHYGRNKIGADETLSWVKKFSNGTLIGRFVRPEEVAHAVIFIAENDALAGQVLTLDGGTSLKGLA